MALGSWFWLLGVYGSKIVEVLFSGMCRFLLGGQKVTLAHMAWCLILGVILILVQVSGYAFVL